MHIFTHLKAWPNLQPESMNFHWGTFGMVFIYDGYWRGAFLSKFYIGLKKNIANIVGEKYKP